jgi:broad specificity phosphatase PhoE
MRKRLYLIRHAHAPAIGEDGIIRSYPGHPLSEEGRRQGEALAEGIKDSGIESLWSSDALRALQTAEIISRKTGIPVKVEPLLREFSIGEIENKHIFEAKEILKDSPIFNGFRKILPHEKFPGGENMIELEKRVIPAIEKILREDPAEKIGIVAHGGVNRIILIHFLELPYTSFSIIEQDYACLNILDFIDGYVILHALNLTLNDILKQRKDIKLPGIPV